MIHAYLDAIARNERAVKLDRIAEIRIAGLQEDAFKKVMRELRKKPGSVDG